MNDVIIDIENIGKRYTLRHQQRPDSIKAWLRSLARQTANPAAQSPAEEFWAIRDVCLQVRRGECLGLVGDNGAGKSTLLKILSRIIPPTLGRIRITGRVASLLEVGTGFHPDLTGRENVYLNGAMLGCPEREIRRRFDSIVDFSGVERFLDTPVKHYSSGMYVRLAYSVAAHVDSDIQIIDEVLSVGDSNFQKKCLENVSLQIARGKTIIFVSHDKNLLARLATRTINMHQGRIADAVPG